MSMSVADLFSSPVAPSIELFDRFTKSEVNIFLRSRKVWMVNWGRMKKEEAFSYILILWNDVHLLVTTDHAQIDVDMINDIRVKIARLGLNASGSIEAPGQQSEEEEEELLDESSSDNGLEEQQEQLEQPEPELSEGSYDIHDIMTEASIEREGYKREIADLKKQLDSSNMSAAAAEQEAFPITFMINNTKMSFSMDVTPNTTISDVKATIQDEKGILPDQMRLCYNGKFMDDGYVHISAYGIRKHATVYLVTQCKQQSINQTSN